MTPPTSPRPDPSLASIEERLLRIEALLLRLSPALEAVEQVPAGLAVATDSFDRLIDTWTERGIDVGARLATAVRLLERVTSPEVLAVIEEGVEHHQAVSRIFKSGAFDAPALEIISKLASSVASASARSTPTGLWGAMRAAGSSQVQYALGFAVALATHFGSALAEERNPPELTKGDQ